MPNSTKSTNQEEIKMRKLIVEAPELKEGQSDSSGGIRENGKMSVQYKNPVPYVEPTIPPVVPQKTYTRKDSIISFSGWNTIRSYQSPAVNRLTLSIAIYVSEFVSSIRFLALSCAKNAIFTIASFFAH